MNAEITAAWMPGFESMFKADAQLVAEEIVSIGEKATPIQILDKARNPETELHKCFEWDDSIAAEKYRLSQARKVVCNLVIRETVKEESPPIRFFYQPKNGSGYHTTQIIYKDPDKYQALLASVLRELVSIRNKHSNLAELDGVFAAIDEAVQGKAS